MNKIPINPGNDAIIFKFLSHTSIYFFNNITCKPLIKNNTSEFSGGVSQVIL